MSGRLDNKMTLTRKSTRDVVRTVAGRMPGYPLPVPIDVRLGSVDRCPVVTYVRPRPARRLRLRPAASGP